MTARLWLAWLRLGALTALVVCGVAMVKLLFLFAGGLGRMAPADLRLLGGALGWASGAALLSGAAFAFIDALAAAFPVRRSTVAEEVNKRLIDIKLIAAERRIRSHDVPKEWPIGLNLEDAIKDGNSVWNVYPMTADLASSLLDFYEALGVSKTTEHS